MLGTALVGLFVIVFLGCEPFVNEFSDLSEAQMYTSSNIIPVSVKNDPVVMTWNIRFGAGRIPFFGDSCGDRVLMTDAETMEYLTALS